MSRKKDLSRKEDLRASAASALLWGVGAMVARDVIQFAAMLVMMRLLSPEIYGQAALAQTVIGFLATASFKSVAGYALQARDPDVFDWDAHFTAAVVLNMIAFVVTVVLALVFRAISGDTFETLGLVLLAMSPVFLVEIASTYQVTWLQAHHRWRALRLLLIGGSLLSVCLGIVIAALGGGVYALAISSWALGIPFLVALLASPAWPRLRWRALACYGGGLRFGLNRGASGGLGAGVALAEQSLLTGFFGFAALGAYTRAIGLSQLTSGRIGPGVAQALYPVLTRAEARSEQFRSFSGFLIQGVVWVSTPAAAFFAVEAEATVALLYGPGWSSVAPLLPLACTYAALQGLATTLNSTMLANLRHGDCLKIEMIAAVTKLAVIAAVMPFGVAAFLGALVAHSVAIVGAASILGVRSGAIDGRKVARVSAPAVAASVCAAAAAAAMPELVSGDDTVAAFSTLALKALIFGLIYLVILRALGGRALAELLYALPLGARARRAVGAIVPSRRTVSGPA